MGALSSDEWERIEPSLVHEGFAYGFSCPSIVETIAVPSMSGEKRAKVQSAFLGFLEGLDGLAPCPPPDIEPGNDSPISSLNWFLSLADHLNMLAGLPIPDPALRVWQADGAACCAVPCLVNGIQPMSRLLGHIRAMARSVDDMSGHECEQIRQAFANLLHSKPQGSNGPRYLRAAFDDGIVVQELPGDAIQFGLGRRSMVMHGSFTQNSSQIGTRLARRKDHTSRILARHRLPVARFEIVTQADQAAASAARIGYPIVIKPADLDNGVGVQADLRNETEVRAALKAARKFSVRIMVEKHFDGRDYRLTVLHDRVIWAIERKPAGVIGNGRSSIAELVEMENSNPLRGIGAHAALKRLQLEREANDLLARDGMTAETVPEVDQFVRLRRASNISAGGTPIAMFDQVHPENAALAIRAAQALRLDLAGIDLIIPDIATPWHQSGAIICEVNADPEIGGTISLHIYPEILRALLHGDGNIPVIAILGASRAEALAVRIADALGEHDIRAGLHVRQGMKVAGRWLEKGDISCLAAGRVLTADQTVEALILAAIDADVVRTGMPVPRIDLLVVTGENVPDAEGRPGGDGEKVATSISGFLKPCCERIALVAPDGESHEIAGAAHRMGIDTMDILKEEQLIALILRISSEKTVSTA